MDEYNKIFGLATGAPQQALAGLGTSANLDTQETIAKKTAKANLQAQLAAQEAQKEAAEEAGKANAMTSIGYGLAAGGK